MTWNGAQPQLGEPLDSSAERRRWRATIEGRPALVIEVEARTEADAAQIAERLRRLGNHPDASLRPLLGWAHDGRTVSVATDADDGRTLDDVLKDGPLTPPEAAAVGWSVLTALQVLHEAGLAHGSVEATQVWIKSNGQVQLGGQWFNSARRATSDDLLTDVEGSGALVSRALGIGPHPDPGSGPTPAERDAPALTRTVRAIAGGASGANVSGARMALVATAGSLVQPEGIARAAQMLAARLRGEPVRPVVEPVPEAIVPATPPTPPSAPPPPEPSVAALPIPPEPGSPRPVPGVPRQRYVASADDFRELRRRPGFDLGQFAFPVMVAGAILIALAALWGVVTVVRGVTAGHPAANVTTPTPPPAAHATATPKPPSSATPTLKPSGPPPFGPASAAPITSVELAASGCSPGGSCGVEVTVHTAGASSANDVTWTIKAYDVCSGTTTDLATNKVTEQQGWTSVIGDNTVNIPSGKAIQLVAITSAPATAASPVVSVGGTSC